MSERHPDAADFVLYVMDGLPAARVGAFEAHAATCDACAAALVREARLDAAMRRVAFVSARSSWHRTVRATACGAAGVVAMAAAVLLWFDRPSSAAGSRDATACGQMTLGDGAAFEARDGG
ncbi:MAG: hypothetical protein ABTD50_14310 [Polyangiaceae bacterium]|jgi:ferric-dicitrate binding protein FerR (iron transport regulator)